MNGAASCFQWSFPEKETPYFSLLALQCVGASPEVRHHLSFSPLGMSGEGKAGVLLSAHTHFARFFMKATGQNKGGL